MGDSFELVHMHQLINYLTIRGMGSRAGAFGGEYRFWLCLILMAITFIMIMMMICRSRLRMLMLLMGVKLAPN